MEQRSLIITSIADSNHPILTTYSKETLKRNIRFIIIGDQKSPKIFNLSNCDYYSIEKQLSLNLKLAKILPLNHYSRKNLGYLVAISSGARKIIETDDDNIPTEEFWEARSNLANAHLIYKQGWVNIYKYFTETHIWPRGFALEHLHNNLPELENLQLVDCPIQQGLADGNPDVDAIYRLTLDSSIIFNKSNNIALGKGSYCPFNSQNTTWFKKAFPLLYLPSYCSFRMTDIWRSFIAQRILWSCGWSVLFHQSTVRQERNNHNLMVDFQDELQGYINNKVIMDSLISLELKLGEKNIPNNMRLCYNKLIELGFVAEEEMFLLDAWLEDINKAARLI